MRIENDQFKNFRTYGYSALMADEMTLTPL